jgi:hypothetical protein
MRRRIAALYCLFAVHSTGVSLLAQSATFIDVTNPPAGLEAVIPNDGSTNDDGEDIQAIINWVKDSGKQAVIYLPPSDGTRTGTHTGEEGYRIASQITISNASGITLVGGGRQRGGGASVDSYTKLTWKGGTTGPMLLLQDVNGLVLRRLTFVGRDPMTMDPLVDVLVRHTNALGGTDSLDVHVADCAFFTAARLWHNTGLQRTGHLYFENCMFRGDHGTTDLNEAAFYNDSLTGWMFTFDHCVFNFCNTCFYLTYGGRLQVYGGGVALCRRWIHREDRDSGYNGISSRDVYFDAGGTARMVWYSSGKAGVGDEDGNVLFESMHMQNDYPAQGANFVKVAAFTGAEENTIQLAPGLDMLNGQKIAFFAESNHDARANPGAIATIKSRVSADQYELYETLDQLGVRDLLNMGKLDAAHGDPLFILTGGEQLVVRDCTLKHVSVTGKRLCSLEKGTDAGGRTPVAHFIRTNGLSYDPMNLQATLVDRYLDIKSMGTGDVYYRFRDCQKDGLDDPPVSITNIP